MPRSPCVACQKRPPPLARPAGCIEVLRPTHSSACAQVGGGSADIACGFGVGALALLASESSDMLAHHHIGGRRAADPRWPRTLDGRTVPFLADAGPDSVVLSRNPTNFAWSRPWSVRDQRWPKSAQIRPELGHSWLTSGHTLSSWIEHGPNLGRNIGPRLARPRPGLAHFAHFRRNLARAMSGALGRLRSLTSIDHRSVHRGPARPIAARLDGSARVSCYHACDRMQRIEARIAELQAGWLCP